MGYKPPHVDQIQNINPLDFHRKIMMHRGDPLYRNTIHNDSGNKIDDYYTLQRESIREQIEYEKKNRIFYDPSSESGKDFYMTFLHIG
jgi:hypothetical protein